MKKLYVKDNDKEIFILSSYNDELIDNLEKIYQKSGFNTSIKYISPWNALFKEAYADLDFSNLLPQISIFKKMIKP